MMPLATLPVLPRAAARGDGRALDLQSGASVFVTLTIAGQLCGVPVHSVRDVLREQPITRIPLAPPEIAGSLNLRGRIVTAIDLRRRLQLPPAAAGAHPMSLVAEHDGELYALQVDQVCEVLSPEVTRFEPNPPTLPPAWTRYCTGIYRLETNLMLVLDLSRLLALTPEGP
ncbi:MAG: chemotaxis protein CheW [Acetobacteraceae bacterium]